MAERKINVAVIMGGTSSEHEISVKSGVNVCNALSRGHFNVKPVHIARSGRWLVGEGWLSPGTTYDSPPSNLPELSPVEALSALQADSVDVAFIALHGPGGEDGTIQGFFETAGMAYTGSGVLGNAVGMDKILTKQVLRGEGLLTPAFIKEDCADVRNAPDRFVSRIEHTVGFPCVAKISNEGSSRNVAVTRTTEELRTALVEICCAGDELLVEEFIAGREITCAVIDRPGDGQSTALPPTELVPKSSEWFDYHAKYTPGATDEITPAPLSPHQTSEVQRIARICHKALHCSGMSRTDMLMKDDRFYVIEINTIPGLTETSLIPQAASVAGIDFATLLDIQVMWALERHNRRTEK